MASQHPQRSTVLDGVRGVAVLSMIVAHGLYFFHTGSNSILSWIQNALNTVSFTMFIFVAGAIASKQIDKYRNASLKSRFWHTVKYVSVLYIGYLIVGVLGVVTTVPHFDAVTLPAKILGAITMIEPTNFTEYIPVFIILPLVLLVATPLFLLARRSLLFLTATSAVFYGLGVVLFPIQLPALTNSIKEIFAGGQDVLRFPILFYLPVYLFGIWWEHNIEAVGDTPGTERKHVLLLAASVLITYFCIIFANYFDIPVLNPVTRWPPSLGFLSIGISSTILLIFLGSAMPRPSMLNHVYKFIIYLGRDAYDIWITHLLFLFLYREYIGMRFDILPAVFFLIVVFIITTVVFSSITLVNYTSVSHFGHFSIVPSGQTRFRKRYGVLASLVIMLLGYTFYAYPTKYTYGKSMSPQSVSVFDRLSKDSKIILVADKLWHIRSGPKKNSVNLTLQALDPESGKFLRINPTTVTFLFPSGTKNLTPTSESETALIYSIPASDLPVEKMAVVAQISDEFNLLKSNPVNLIVSEPLTVAWTFDWEGWEASDSALLKMINLSKNYDSLPFTHFVNPRMFLSELVPKQRAEVMKSYLLGRVALGDEIALHTHMQYDLVTASGVVPRTGPHWGLMSNEGYDVPATVYTPAQFRQIVRYAKSVLESNGFPTPRGYRAGGWYISSEQLSTLKELGFDYDASGRDRPTTGAFRNTPWDLPLGAQPYYPYSDNQNVASPRTEGIFEIPGNGSLYELGDEELIRRISYVYTEGVLESPKALVYTTHPQFANFEFSKIPKILDALKNISADLDAGPVVFVTMSDIYDLWKSF